ncbi:MAG: PP2C family serine/threonine-protein phosphatase, partial [Runella zeae]
AEIFYGFDNEEYFISIVSDGAGSAANADRGADLACISAIKSIERSLGILNQDEINEVCIRGWINDIQDEIIKEANYTELPVRDFACTILGAVVSRKKSFFFQIGDGAIMASCNQVKGIVFPPEYSEYVNLTHFVTDKNAIDHLQVFITSSPITEIAIFSDGIQHLALSFKTLTPHLPFFEPMLEVLRKCDTDRMESLNYQLASFLNSKQVNERTDDDKTLVLATRLDENIFE